MSSRSLRRAAWLLLGGALVCTSAAIGVAREPAPPPAPDPAFYRQRVAPWIEANCASCHRRSGAGLALSSASDLAARRAADFKVLARYVDATAPWDSRLIRKLIAPAQGGESHVGGSFVEPESEEHDLLLDFVSGSTLDNVPPEPYLGEEALRVRPGEQVVIDGRDSYDRDRDDMERLTYWWTLVAHPPDSRIALTQRRASRFVLKPDVPGSYVVSLRVGDGKVVSAPRRLVIEVFERPEVKRKQAGGISGLERLEVRDLRRIRRVYLDVFGRPPTPAEAIAETRGGLDGLFATLAVRSEYGTAWYEELTARYGLLDAFRPRSQAARSLALRIPSEVLTPPQVHGALLTDPAFLERHPPGRALAHVIARKVFGRAPSASELEAHARLARGEAAQFEEVGEVSDPAAWVAALVRTSRFRAATIERRLERFLLSGDLARRMRAATEAATEGGAAWRAFLVKVFSSRSYLDRSQLRPKEDVTYVRSLFFDLLERRPTERELASTLHAVQQMPGRSAPLAMLARILIESGEVPLPLLVDIADGPAWIRDRFLRYLGRPPSESELADYKNALKETLSPELVVLALVTTPEYACR